jgi:hypothetical protein
LLVHCSPELTSQNVHGSCDGSGRTPGGVMAMRAATSKAAMIFRSGMVYVLVQSG